MPTQTTRIIAAVDGSEDASRAAAVAAGLAREMKRPLTLLYVFPAPGPHEFVSLDSVTGALSEPAVLSPQGLEEASRKAAEKVFAAARKAIGDGVEIEERVVHGAVVPEIGQVAEGLKPAIVVVGRRGLGRLGEFLLGSVSNKLVHQHAFPVLVV
jgi:nucleotide-binding universal stress UspA family protein